MRWGVGDAVWAFVFGTLVSVFAAAFVLDASTPVQLVVLLFSQDLAIIAYLVGVARWRGMGSLRADFGLRFDRDAWSPGDLAFFGVGIALQVAWLAPLQLLQDVYGHTAKQAVVNDASKAHGVVVVLTVLGVALLAPLTEELLFRGALLRALLRRTRPEYAVFVSAVAFGIVHIVGDLSIGSLMALPAIISLGLLSGYQAVRTGTLTRSVLLHIGFNALSVVFIFTT